MRVVEERLQTTPRLWGFSSFRLLTGGGGPTHTSASEANQGASPQSPAAARRASCRGGGADYWTSKRVGVRFEVRDNIHSPLFGTATHFWGPRIGIVLRGK
jgi:hypothetical protein